MNHRHLGAALGSTLLLLAACASPGSRAVGGLDFMVVERAKDPATAPIRFAGRGYVGSGQSWHAQVGSLRRAIDADGSPAIAFSLIPSDRERFASFTERNIGKDMAVSAGQLVMSIATIGDRLPGAGTISVDGNDPARVERWIAAIEANR